MQTINYTLFERFSKCSLYHLTLLCIYYVDSFVHEGVYFVLLEWYFYHMCFYLCIIIVTVVLLIWKGDFSSIQIGIGFANSFSQNSHITYSNFHVLFGNDGVNYRFKITRWSYPGEFVNIFVLKEAILDSQFIVFTQMYTSLTTIISCFSSERFYHLVIYLLSRSAVKVFFFFRIIN